MLSASVFFTLLGFSIINFLILFLVKTRITTVISLIIAHLVCVLFFSISITNQEYFKELTLVLIIYSMVILFLISNEDLAHKVTPLHKGDSYKVLLVKIITATTFFAVIFAAVFFLTKNLDQVARSTLKKKIELESKIANNPLNSPSYGVHDAAKRGKFTKNSLDKLDSKFMQNDKKLARLRDNLTDNFLLKRSSDMIIIIVAISSILLLLSNKKNNKK
jgi:hypothetical protein